MTHRGYTFLQGQHTAIPYHLLDVGSVEDRVERRDGWVEALGWEVDGGCDGSALAGRLAGDVDE
jgi:hypothetical protein